MSISKGTVSKGNLELDFFELPDSKEKALSILFLYAPFLSFTYIYQSIYNYVVV